MVSHGVTLSKTEGVARICWEGMNGFCPRFAFLLALPLRDLSYN
jgi:hypothetical protein